MASDAVYYDGKSQTSHMVTVEQDGALLLISGRDMANRSWVISTMNPILLPPEGQPFRLTHRNFPGQRLLVRDAQLVSRLNAMISEHSGSTRRRANSSRPTLGKLATGLAIIAGAVYLALAVLPQPVARLMPQSWRARTGETMEAGLAGAASRCTTPGAEHALSVMLVNLANGNPDMPNISIHVYDLPIVNAFALNGGHIIVTSRLLQRADTPEEFAGVLAHEIGHVAHMDPEAQTVREAGLTILTSLMTGKGSSGLAGNAGLLAATLQHSRAAEGAADAYAQEMLDNAAIDPEGLKTFFAKLKKMEDALMPPGSILHGLGTIFSTHPGTDERMLLIKPLPRGVTLIPALDPADWATLTKICG